MNRLLTIKQAAEYLGTTHWSIRTLLWRGEFPFIRLGKKFMVDQQVSTGSYCGTKDLDKWIESAKERNR